MRLLKVTVGFAAAFGAIGCLPDPRPYDACVDELGYYSVPPTGCGKHDLKILSERVNASPFYAQLDISRRRIAIDEDNVYWADSEGAVLVTPKRGGITEVLLTCDDPESIEIQLTDSTVYVQSASAFSETLTGIDKATREVRVVTTLLNSVATGIRVHGDYYYATQGSPTNPPEGSPTNCVLRGSLHSDEAATCFIEADILDFALNDLGLYGVLLSGSLVFYPYDSKEGQTVSTVPAATTLLSGFVYELDDQYAYYTLCEQGGVNDYSCKRVRMSLDPNQFGRSITLTGALGPYTSVRNDGSTTFIVGNGSVDAQWATSRLLAYRPESLEPQVLAASMNMTHTLALDEDFVYALVVDNPEEGQRMRLVRIER